MWEVGKELEFSALEGCSVEHDLDHFTLFMEEPAAQVRDILSGILLFGPKWGKKDERGYAGKDAEYGIVFQKRKIPPNLTAMPNPCKERPVASSR